MTLTEAKTELATIITAIGEYVQGKRRKRFISMVGGQRHEQEFDTPQDLFAYLVKRRTELEAFIAANEVPTTSTLTPNSFRSGRTVPMVFRR